jgi:uncharacterized DUF497 family protein
MSILRFEWDEHNELKLLDRHNVTRAEVEECFYNRHRIKKAGPNIYYLYGQTDEGRALFLVYEVKEGGWLRVYSAREMTKEERGKFRHKK